MPHDLEDIRTEIRQLLAAYLVIHPERAALPADLLRRAAAEVQSP